MGGMVNLISARACVMGRLERVGPLIVGRCGFREVGGSLSFVGRGGLSFLGHRGGS